jgi:hypothetical protein
MDEAYFGRGPHFDAGESGGGASKGHRADPSKLNRQAQNH